ncbi:glycosyltransferase family 9 protein [Magnetospirillum sp. 64-120]|uniref:glycosyltransferase family 9 protein n=1 Tax=Magnetospirillum sp. 64-120 TaxID=1895778 RepID=UPI00092A41E2|nr:glycosyltransferase family 9 protein [Magnetospirillum sp. 64-120]OJX77448.1 MAG: ADP-heptose--LPS heptosyltransferase [Magnetospirillum sp. 64-120]
MSGSRILVIKLGALGDFVQAFAPFAAIRAHHPDAEITLLTTRPFAEMAVASPWFDHVWLDEKPRLWQLGKVAALRAKLRGGRFTRVYDLQTSDRSGWYFRLMGAGVEWSGIAKGCSHPHANPRRDVMHTIDRQAEQLAMAGIESVPAPDLSWTEADLSRFGLPRPYALLCPGGAPHRPAKRWPAEYFGQLAQWLVERGITPVLLGTDKEKVEIDKIAAACPQARPLVGQTGFLDILGLGRQALVAVGNDTGPMHLVAASQAPSLVLFSAESDPALCAPRGRVVILRQDDLADLPPATVMDRIAAILA